MNLTRDQRSFLYMVVWQEPETQSSNAWGNWLGASAMQPLIDGGLVEVKDGRYVGTAKGWEALSPMARTATRRPKDYSKRSESDQWAIDSSLGILDWDGN